MVTISLDSPSCEVTLFDPVYRWFIRTLPDRPRGYTVWSTLEPSGMDSRTWAGIIQVGSATATTWPYSCPLRGTYSCMSVRVKNQITSGGRYVHSSGRMVTRLTAFHISWHVASTFKRLTTATTHCDLINFYQHRRGNLPGHDTAHDPVHHPYSDCSIVNIQFLYRASDRKSPDLCQSY
jgi:hypothetical protein